MTKSVNLRSHEAKRLASSGEALVVRPLKRQPRGSIVSATQWLDGLWRLEHEPVPNVLPDGGLLGNIVGIRVECKFGRVGDVLVGKESFGIDTNGSSQWVVYREGMQKGRDCSEWISHDDAVKRGTPWNGFDWRSSATMPSWASRFPRLVVESIECRRIRTITSSEAERTGVSPVMVDSGGVTPWGEGIEVPDWHDPLIETLDRDVWAEDRYCWFATLRNEVC